VNGDVHRGLLKNYALRKSQSTSHARSGSGTGASRFLIGLVTCFATQDGIAAVAR
jgi:hypothetical protein